MTAVTALEQLNIGVKKKKQPKTNYYLSIPLRWIFAETVNHCLSK